MGPPRRPMRPVQRTPFVENHQPISAPSAPGQTGQSSPAAAAHPPAPPAQPGTAGTHDGKHYAVYANELRVGGSRAWRNNNPGNTMWGDFAQAQGAIGHDTFHPLPHQAIFPDLQTGQNALVANLQRPFYQNKTIAEAIGSYSPPGSNNTEHYIQTLTQQTGLARETLLSTINSEQLNHVVNTIQTVEGSLPGTVIQRGDANAPEWAKQVLGITH